MKKSKKSKNRVIYHTRRRRSLYNPFTVSYVMELLVENDMIIEELRDRIRKFVDNDILWSDVETAVNVLKEIKKVKL